MFKSWICFRAVACLKLDHGYNVVRYRVRSAKPCARQWLRGWSPGKCNCPRAPTVCSWWALSCCTRSDRWRTVTVQTLGQAIGCFSATGCLAARRLWLSNTAIRRDRPRGNRVDLPWTDQCSAVLQYTRNMGSGKITRMCVYFCIFYMYLCMCVSRITVREFRCGIVVDDGADYLPTFLDIGWKKKILYFTVWPTNREGCEKVIIRGNVEYLKTRSLGYILYKHWTLYHSS